MSAKIPAASLIATGACSAVCLLAQEPDGKCRCRCASKYHGALAEVEVEQPAGYAWWAASGNAGWHPGLIQAYTPIAHAGRQETDLYREARAAQEPFSLVAATKGGYAVRWDGITLPYRDGDPPRWPAREAGLLNRLTVALLKARRIQSGTAAPCEHFSAYPFRDLDEACVMWHIVGELWCSNPASAVRAIEVIEGRPDPVSLGLNPEKGYPEQLAISRREMATA